ncbi:MAG: glycoside hydrolase family 125 protein [bacterium]|nr:glycoside hydrolase family 125 protein [bacterium]
MDKLNSRKLDETLTAIKLSDPELDTLFHRCFKMTWDETLQVCSDGSVFVNTGDIPAMWLRDSAAQVYPYLLLCNEDAVLPVIIRGVITRQMRYILIDPYANAFNLEPNGKGHKTDDTIQNDWVWERKFELDSLLYPIQLLWAYWNITNDETIFTSQIKETLITIIRTLQTEQNHQTRSSYHFFRNNQVELDNLPNLGKGNPIAETGMIWSAFRPSDDRCLYNYHIPSQMFAVVVLAYLSQILIKQYQEFELASEVEILREQIDAGINQYGIYTHPKYGEIYVYETDGLGTVELMDDANIPSLLSIPYLGYVDNDDPIYKNTRKFILSPDNPCYFSGKYASGIGSPHTGKGKLWHLALIMQALITDDPLELDRILNYIKDTHAGTYLMHESFNPDNPAEYTRASFSWANALFSELILTKVAGLD